MQGVHGKGGDRRLGEEGKVEGFAGHVGDCPLGGFTAAEGVLVQELFVRGDIHAIEVAAAFGFGVEERAGFVVGDRADLREGKRREVDDELCVGDKNFAGDGFCGSALGVPVAFVLRVECGRGEKQGGGEDAKRTS